MMRLLENLSLSMPLIFFLIVSCNSEKQKTLVEIFPLRYKRQEVLADHEIVSNLNSMQQLESIPKEIDGEIIEIPAQNRRVVKLFQLPFFNPDETNDIIDLIKQAVFQRESKFEDKLELQTRELKLLSHNLVAKCFWFYKIPKEMDPNGCTIDELDYLLERFSTDGLTDTDINK